MSEKHYDGNSPLVPLPADHFTKEQQEEAHELGDGSPGIDPRGNESGKDGGGTEAHEESDEHLGKV